MPAIRPSNPCMPSSRRPVAGGRGPEPSFPAPMPRARFAVQRRRGHPHRRGHHEASLMNLSSMGAAGVQQERPVARDQEVPLNQTMNWKSAPTARRRKPPPQQIMAAADPKPVAATAAGTLRRPDRPRHLAGGRFPAHGSVHHFAATDLVRNTQTVLFFLSLPWQACHDSMRPESLRSADSTGAGDSSPSVF